MSPSIAKEPEQQPVQGEQPVEDKKRSSTINNNNTENKTTKAPSSDKVSKPAMKSRYGRAIKHVYLDNSTFNTFSTTKSSSSKILKDVNGSSTTTTTTKLKESECTKENGVAIEDDKMEIGSLADEKPEEIIVNVKMEAESEEAIDDEEIKKEITQDEEEVQVKSETGLDDKQWFVGQVAWAHISNYPYWPCIITLEPGTDIYRKEKAFNRRKPAKFIHVQYFGDRGRHGWVDEIAIMEYHGIDDFNKLAAEALLNIKKTDKRHSCFTFKHTIKNKWQVAVDEAEQMVLMNVEDRIDIAEKTCATKIKRKKEISIKTENDTTVQVVSTGRKRGRPPRVSIEPNAKKAKINTTINDEFNNDNDDDDDDDKSNIMNLTADVPPTPPSSVKDSSDESSIVRKSNSGGDVGGGSGSGKRRKTIKAGDFEIYFLAKKNYMINLPENTTDDDLRLFLKESWDKMLPWQRGQYSSDSTPNFTPTKRRRKKSLNLNNELSNNNNDSRRRRRHRTINKSKSITENDNKTMEKDSSSLSTTSSSILEASKKIKPLNLFKGIRSERVCQICEKTGKLIRCRGPCYSYFHLDCVKPSDSESERDVDEEDPVSESIETETVTESSSLSSSSSTRSSSPSPAMSPGGPDETPEESDPPPATEATKKEEEETPPAAATEATKKEKEEPPAATEENPPVTKEETSSKKEDSSAPVKKEDSTEGEYFKCIDCLSGVAPACFICNEREEERTRCSMSACGKHYHSACLKLWPQSHWQGERLTCPYHMCHTCISDNPQSYHSRAVTHDKLVRCVRCPSAYHTSSSCVPAGTQILTGNQVICPKHYVSNQAPLNAAWCFLCTRGGSLICCDTCPTSFHAECLGINPPEGAFICEDCETGRLPLYGEVVWVKLGHWRWWPSRICFPHEIPDNLESLSHSSGEFCIMFFGTHNYYWAHRGRCFLYQDGDLNAKVTAIGKKNLDESYKKAVDEANDLYQYLKNEKHTARNDIQRSKKSLKPPHYVKLKANRPVGNVKPVVEVESIVACECKPTWEHPCSSDTDCLNRILSIECDPTICPAGTKCNNQSFVSRNYPSMEPFHTAGRGWGLKSRENIKNGQFVIEYVGEIIDEHEYKRRLSRKKELRNENYYFLTIDNYRLIDAEPKGNLSRFMNHSCQPNCETQKWTVNGDTRIGIFAIRDIDVDEELTFNYNLSCDGEKKKPCLCGAPNCSGFIGLKAQKLQLNGVPQPVKATTTPVETPEKVKRRKKPSKRIFKCWTCSIDVDENIAIQCEMKSCRKRYHRECVQILDDNTKFSCPWHHCIDCSRRTTAHCSFCSTAYCHRHLQGRLTEQKERGGYLCQAHEDLLFEDDQEDVIGDVGGREDKRPLSPEYPEPEESDEDFDAASLLADSDSPLADEDEDTVVNTDTAAVVATDATAVAGDDTSASTPISIIEVQLNNEENEESKIEDVEASSDVGLDNNSGTDRNNKINLMGYTAHQLRDIIGIDSSGDDDDL